MSEYITHLNVSLNEAEEVQLRDQDYKKINLDLNKGAGGNDIFLWYKNERGVAPITRIQISYNGTRMHKGLMEAGYTKISKNLNAGTNGTSMYLWFFRGNTEYDTPIQDIAVTSDPQEEVDKLKNNWEMMSCDLNRRAGGKWIFLWVKRAQQTYICDVFASESFSFEDVKFKEGYHRIDEDLNRDSGAPPDVFLWYRCTTNPWRALTHVAISTDDQQYDQYQQSSFTPLSVNLNEGAKGNTIFLWYKKEEGKAPIKAIQVLVYSKEKYENAGFRVIQRNLNTGNDGLPMFLCVSQ